MSLIERLVYCLGLSSSSNELFSSTLASYLRDAAPMARVNTIMTEIRMN
jgi:hypothetical protein